MNKMVLKNCIIFKSNKFEDIKEEITKYDKEKNEVIIKFSKTGDIILAISNLNLNNIYSKKNLKKQSIFILSNVEITKYKIKKNFNTLRIDDIKYMQSKNLMIKRNNINKEYYLINKKSYDSDKIFQKIKEVVEEINR